MFNCISPNAWGATAAYYGVLVLIDCRIARADTTKYGGAASCYGGDFKVNHTLIVDTHVDGYASALRITASGVATVVGGGILRCRAGSYGVIYVGASARLRMTNVSIQESVAGTNGGAFRNEGTTELIDTSIARCTAGDTGGGVSAGLGVFTMWRGSITSCHARGAEGGGGISVTGGTATIWLGSSSSTALRRRVAVSWWMIGE
jgi:hypothetical protein